MAQFFRLLFVALIFALIPFTAYSDDCAMGKLEQPSSDKAQKFAEHVQQIDPCKVGGGIKASSLKVVWENFLSSNHTGGKRFDTPPPEGSPTGTVMPNSGFVEFDFSQVASEGMLTFILESSGRRLAAVHNPKADFTIPAHNLDIDSSYTWELVTGQNTYHGTFNLIDPDDQKDVEMRLADLNKANLDPDTYLLYSAAIYDDAGLYSARDKAFHKLSMRIGM